MTSRPATQSGSAFFLILIGIFMFAGLTYAVMQSGRTSQATLTAEQARLKAQEIIAYADTVSKAVTQLRLNGCTESQISLEFPDATWLHNPTAPADESCNVFSMSGGKVNYQPVDAAAIEPPVDNGWWATGGINVKDLGTSNSELLLIAASLKPEVCDAVNMILLGKHTAIETTTGSNDDFTGTYGTTADGYGFDTNSIYSGKSAACLDEGGTWRSFYQVLIVR